MHNLTDFCWQKTKESSLQFLFSGGLGVYPTTMQILSIISTFIVDSN